MEETDRLVEYEQSFRYRKSGIRYLKIRSVLLKCIYQTVGEFSMYFELLIEHMEFILIKCLGDNKTFITQWKNILNDDIHNIHGQFID